MEDFTLAKLKTTTLNKTSPNKARKKNEAKLFKYVKQINFISQNGGLKSQTD